MESTISCDTSTSYSRAENGKDLASKTVFTCVAFLPQYIETKGFSSDPDYEDFGTLICRANCWLRENRQWNITTCETLKSDITELVDSNKTNCCEYYEKSTYYVRSLRLRLSERKDDFERVHQIGVLNLIPQQVGVKGICRSPIYETIDEMLSRLNSTPESNPIPGRVITVETIEVSSYPELDPDRSCWKEDRKDGKHFRFVIRIFYEVMAGSHEEIGIKDFVPDCVSEGGCCSGPDYEPFSCVVSKASDWCRQQQGLRFCNDQRLEIRTKRGKDIDTQKVDYKKHGIRPSFNVQILRICYTKSPSNLNLQIDMPISFRHIISKTFAPISLSIQYETLSQTKGRVTAWVTATGAQVFSAETEVVRRGTVYELEQGRDAFICYEGAGTKICCIFFIRLYLDWVFNEAPLEVSPNVPHTDSQCCCIVS